jgi:hypothetical protein
MLCAMSQSGPVKLVRACDGLAVGEVSNVCIVLWRGAVTRDRFDLQRDGLAEVTRRHPERAGFLCVIEPTATPPGDELRRASADMIAAHQPHLRCIACVVEGTGFKNSISRSALSAMALLLRSRTVPLSVFGTVGAAAMWMVPHIDARDADLLARSVDALRAELASFSRGS